MTGVLFGRSREPLLRALRNVEEFAGTMQPLGIEDPGCCAAHRPVNAEQHILDIGGFAAVDVDSHDCKPNPEATRKRLMLDVLVAAIHSAREVENRLGPAHSTVVADEMETITQKETVSQVKHGAAICVTTSGDRQSQVARCLVVDAVNEGGGLSVPAGTSTQWLPPDALVAIDALDALEAHRSGCSEVEQPISGAAEPTGLPEMTPRTGLANSYDGFKNNPSIETRDKVLAARERLAASGLAPAKADPAEQMAGFRMLKELFESPLDAPESSTTCDNQDMVVALGQVQFACCRAYLCAQDYFRDRIDPSCTRHAYFTSLLPQLGNCRVHYLNLEGVGWANPLDWPLFYTFIDPLTLRTAQIDDDNVETLAQWFRHFEMPQMLAECEQHLAHRNTKEVEHERQTVAARLGELEIFINAAKDQSMDISVFLPGIETGIQGLHACLENTHRQHQIVAMSATTETNAHLDNRRSYHRRSYNRAPQIISIATDPGASRPTPTQMHDMSLKVSELERHRAILEDNISTLREEASENQSTLESAKQRVLELTASIETLQQAMCNKFPHLSGLSCGYCGRGMFSEPSSTSRELLVKCMSNKSQSTWGSMVKPENDKITPLAILGITIMIRVMRSWSIAFRNLLRVWQCNARVAKGMDEMFNYLKYPIEENTHPKLCSNFSLEALELHCNKVGY